MNRRYAGSAAAERAMEEPRALGLSFWGLSELVEAAARCRKPDAVVPV
jgi:hypothetical protein